jgi:DNA-binding transcriptional regulator YiaG
MAYRRSIKGGPKKMQLSRGKIQREIELAAVALGLKQSELAERLGVHPMTVSRWERGIGSISRPVEQLVRMFVASSKSEGPKRRKQK